MLSHSERPARAAQPRVDLDHRRGDLDDAGVEVHRAAGRQVIRAAGAMHQRTAHDVARRVRTRPRAARARRRRRRIPPRARWRRVLACAMRPSRTSPQSRTRGRPIVPSSVGPRSAFRLLLRPSGGGRLLRHRTVSQRFAGKLQDVALPAPLAASRRRSRGRCADGRRSARVDRRTDVSRPGITSRASAAKRRSCRGVEIRITDPVDVDRGAPAVRGRRAGSPCGAASDSRRWRRCGRRCRRPRGAARGERQQNRCARDVPRENAERGRFSHVGMNELPEREVA